MKPRDLCNLLILLPLGACMGEEVGDVPGSLAYEEVPLDLSPTRAIATGEVPAESPEVVPPDGLPPATVDEPMPPVADGIPAPAADVDLVWNGDQWFAVWSDRRGGDADIRGALVGADGAIEPPQGILLIGAAGDQKHPQVAFTNGRYLVVYTDSSSDANRVRAARVSLDGVVLDAGGFTLGVALPTTQAADVAGNGTSFYVVYQSGSGVYGQRVSSSGAVGPVAHLSAQATAPRLAWNGNDFLAVWTAIGTDLDVGARIIHGDASLGPAAVVSSAAGYQEQPVVAAGAGGFLIAWQDAGALVATTFDPNGMQPVVLARSIVGQPALAGSDQGFAIGVTTIGDGTVAVRSLSLDAHLALVADWTAVRLPAADDGEIDDKHPAIAVDAGGRALVSWQDLADDDATTVWARPALSNQGPFLVTALAD